MKKILIAIATAAYLLIAANVIATSTRAQDTNMGMSAVSGMYNGLY